MRINTYVSYYLLLLLFPLSFLLHNINENFGLTGLAYTGSLFIIYSVTTICIALISKLILKKYPPAFVLSFMLLVVNFLFGAYKDFADKWHFPQLFRGYLFLLPLLLLILTAAAVYLKRSGHTFVRLSGAMAFFLVVNCAVEAGWYLYNEVTKADFRHAFNDYDHSAIRDALSVKPPRKPTVFWLVFDEYSNSQTLRKRWGYQNPLDSVLRSRKFYLPDSPRSNYNYTHYSISSILDMTYLKGLKNHSVVHLRDRRKEEIAILDNNTVRLFEKNGYAIRNFSIFNLRNHPTQGLRAFIYLTRNLINFQTFAGRMSHDIGWNFVRLFSSGKQQQQVVDSIAEIKNIRAVDTAYKNMQNRCMEAFREGSAQRQPEFFLLHFLLPHAPFMYKPDGSLAMHPGEYDSAKHYVSQVEYTNTVVRAVTDSILLKYRNKDIVVIIQGDHALKFTEDDPMFDQESCHIFYAVYCSDGDYSWWPRSLTAVNSFRIFFNKYFNSKLPLLPDHSDNLYEH